MDPLLRGVCEEYIDSRLEDSEIEKIKNIVDVLDLPISSEEDISLGFVIGSIISQIDSQLLKNYSSLRKENEIEDYLSILQRRASEIKWRFSSLGNKHVESLETVIDIKEMLPVENEKERLPEKNETEDYLDILRKRTSEIKSRFRTWVNRQVEKLKTATIHFKTKEITTEKETRVLYPKTPEENARTYKKGEKQVKFVYNPVFRTRVQKMKVLSTKKYRPRTRTVRLLPSLEEV